MIHLLAAFAASLSLCAPCSSPGDWPQYRGPLGNGSTPDRLQSRAFPETGPGESWRTATERGFSSFCVAAGKVFTLVTRRVEGEAREVCVALAAESGKEVWASSLGLAQYDGGGDAGTEENQGGDGPRSTPSYDAGRVFVLDAHLGLFCFDAKQGELLWQHDLVKDYGGKLISWQNAASPLVEQGMVFVNAGGEGQSLLAFEAESGKLLWKFGTEKITHATPTAATIHGRRQVLFYVQAGLVAVEPASGEVLWRADYPYRTSSGASPVVWEDIVYVSAGYGVGAGAFRILKEGNGFKAELLWRKQNRLMNHWSTPVAHEGHLYGMFAFKEYGSGPLKCVDIATGEERWSQEGFGQGNVILVGQDLIALTDSGELVLVAADKASYKELARAAVLPGKCWSTPAYSEGAVYVRSTSEGVRLVLP